MAAVLEFLEAESDPDDILNVFLFRQEVVELHNILLVLFVGSAVTLCFSFLHCLCLLF